MQDRESFLADDEVPGKELLCESTGLRSYQQLPQEDASGQRTEDIVSESKKTGWVD